MKNWSVDLYLFEQDAATMAHAVLHTDAPMALDSRGETRRDPSDVDPATTSRPLVLCVASRIGYWVSHPMTLRRLNPTRFICTRDGFIGLRPLANMLSGSWGSSREAGGRDGRT